MRHIEGTVRPYLADLIRRMATVEPSPTNSEESISWHAHREAEALNDTSMLEELRSVLPSKRETGERSAAYFALGWVGANSGSTRAAGILVESLPSEKNKYALSSLLHALARAPKADAFDIVPVLALLRDKRWLVRHAAIESLKGARSPQAEDSILKLMADNSDADDLCYCHSTLNQIGTPKSLPALTANLKSRKRDVRMSAESAIAAIRARNAA